MRVGLVKLMTLGDNWLVDQLEHMFPEIRPDTWSSSVRRHLRASSISQRCELAVQFELLGHRTAAQGQGLRRMENGTAMHERWNEYFRRLPCFVGHDIVVESPDGTVKGSIDIVVLDPRRGQEVVIEMKSAGSWGYKAMPEPGTREDNLSAMLAAHPGYVAQLMTYVRYHGAAYGGLLFENKDNQEYKIYFIDYDQSVWETLTERSFIALEATKQGRRLMQPYEHKSKQCGMCGHLALCKSVAKNDPETMENIRERLERVKEWE